jgi:hypothetical protein
MDKRKVTKANVFGAIYRIRRVPHGHENLTAEDGSTDNNGMCVPDEPAIYLNEKLTPERERLTLAHELAHAIEIHFGLDLPEEVVDAYGRGLLYLIRHNPALVRFLMRSDDPEEE